MVAQPEEKLAIRTLKKGCLRWCGWIIRININKYLKQIVSCHVTQIPTNFRPHEPTVERAAGKQNTSNIKQHAAYSWNRVPFHFQVAPPFKSVEKYDILRQKRPNSLITEIKSIKSTTEKPIARHRCDVSLKGAVVPERDDTEMGPDNSLHISA